MKFKSPNDIIFMQNIIPENVSIWYENSTPYLDYTGTTMTNKGKIRLHFPKLGLAFDKIVVEESEPQNVYISKDSWVDCEFLERSMTKEEIEKELGYKINIVSK